MYKGNMQDFIDKLHKYLYEKYGAFLGYDFYNGNWGNKGYQVYIFKNYSQGHGSATCYYVTDAEDFEQQVINIAKRVLNLEEL